MNDRDAVLATLEEYADAYCAKNAERLMALFDDSDDISLIGTGADELCNGRSKIKEVFLRNFSEATATRFEWDWQHVTVSNGCAVVATTLNIHLDTEEGSMKVPVRWTVSLVKRGGHMAMVTSSCFSSRHVTKRRNGLSKRPLVVFRYFSDCVGSIREVAAASQKD